MNLRRSAFLGALLFVAALSVVAVWSRAGRYLAGARIGPVLAAAALYSTGFLVFAAIWATLARTADREVASAQRPRAGFAATFRIGIASLGGLLTPFNLGTDILRSTLGKHYLGLEYAHTAAASLVTRECKLHVSLALLATVAAAMGVVGAGLPRARLLGALAGLVGVALLLAAFRSGAAARLTSSLGVGSLAETARTMSGQLHWAARGSVYLCFAAGFAAEWQALRLCCHSLGVRADPASTLAAYGILHFVSRAPVLPMGVGAVEAAGLAWFHVNRMPAEQAGAVVILWGLLRLVVPYLLAVSSITSLLLDRRRSSST